MKQNLQQTSAFRAWIALQERERQLVKVMVGFLVLVLLYLLIYSPMIESHQQAKQKMDNAQSTWQWLNKQNDKLASMSGKIKQVSINSQSQLTRYLQQQLARLKLKSAVSSISPINVRGNEGIEIRFTEVSSPRVIRWLSKMEQEGVVAQELSLVKTKKGMVAVKAVFEVSK